MSLAECEGGPMRPGRCVKTRAHEARRQRLQAFADQGLNLSAAARALGISVPSLTQWFNRHGYDDVRRALKDNSRGYALSAEDARRRLLVVIRTPTLTEAARQLGISTPGLSTWMRDNAPYGAQDALGDWL